jgi:muramidase (phage lysozyme)
MENLTRFLNLIAWSELGSGILAESDNGYNVIVGSVPGKLILFNDYSDHPHRVIQVPIKMRDGTIKIVPSTAAGRYQILGRFFDAYKTQLGLPDFSPASQDRIAITMIRECKALDDIVMGRIPDAILKCHSRWASFPGAGYGQHENKLDKLLEVF